MTSDWIAQKYKDHCVKSVQIMNFFWSVFSCISTKYGKIRTRRNSVFEEFSRSGYIYIRLLIYWNQNTFIFGFFMFFGKSFLKIWLVFLMEVSSILREFRNFCAILKWDSGDPHISLHYLVTLQWQSFDSRFWKQTYLTIKYFKTPSLLFFCH